MKMVYKTYYVMHSTASKALEQDSIYFTRNNQSTGHITCNTTRLK